MVESLLVFVLKQRSKLSLNINCQIKSVALLQKAELLTMRDNKTFTGLSSSYLYDN